jgi:endonuclease G
MLYILREFVLLFAFATVLLHSTYVSAESSFKNCTDKFPFGTEIGLVDESEYSENTEQLCYKSFAVLYSTKHKTPVYSVEVLTKESVEAAKALKRSGYFHVEKGIRRLYSSSLHDYENSGWDRGHATPASSMGDKKSMFESFVLTNVFPQRHDVNIGAWRALERSVAETASASTGETFVFTGTIYSTDSRIMAGRVHVPHSAYKLVYTTTDNCSRVYIVNNMSVAIQDNNVYSATLDELTKLSKVKFNRMFSNLCKQE